MKREDYIKFRLSFHNCATVHDAVEKLEAEALNQADRMKALTRDKRDLEYRTLQLECEMNDTHNELQLFRPELERLKNES